MDRQVRLERRHIMQSESGQPTECWRALATVWGSRAPVRGWERTAGPGPAAHEEVAFEIRWALGLGDLDAKDRIVCDGETYDVQAVQEIGRRRGLKIIATRKAD